MRLSILFCTYERPALLRQALDTVAALAGIGDVDVEVVVSDNSNGGTAAGTVAAFAATVPFPVRYVEAHPANISVARNAAVAAATGDVIAFLDDDMQVDPDWLQAVLAGLAHTDCDVLFGPVRPRFEVPALAGPHAVAMFDRQLPLPTGTRLWALGRNKRSGFPLATSNSVFRRAALAGETAPFDPALGDCGGEDYDLFCRLQRRGRKLGYLAEARTSEFVPARRCDIAYLEQRHYAGAQAFAFCAVKNSDTPFLTGLEVRLKALVQLGQFFLTRGRMDADTQRIRKAMIMGKLQWQRLMPLYRMEAGETGTA